MSDELAYLVSITPQFLILSIAALAQSLMAGYAGITFVASAAFMGLGAYVSAILSIQYKMPLFLSTAIAVMVTAISGVIVSVSLKNIRKDYLAIGTLGFGLILNEIYLNWESVTNGALGITGIPDIPGQNAILTISLICIYTIVRLISRSGFGNLIRAIRDDEILVQSLGKSTLLPRMTVYALSFAVLGLAGAYFGHYLTQVDPSSFGLNDSIGILIIVIIGGIESPAGAIVGAVVFVYLPALLRILGLPPDLAAQARQGVFGLLLIVLMVLRPQGLLGTYRIK